MSQVKEMKDQLNSNGNQNVQKESVQESYYDEEEEQSEVNSLKVDLR